MARNILRSALFKRQLIDQTAAYRDRAGPPTALTFVDRVEDATRFIAARPLACAVYTEIDGKTFRKWGVNGFPVSIFFRIEPDETIVLEALYAHRMDIAGRLPDELE